MTDMIETGLTWLGAQRKAHMARTVTYRRGAASVQVAATIGQTIFRLVEDFGAQVRVVQRDYLIAAAELILSGAVVEPQAGDTIEDLYGTATLVFEVMGPGAGEPDWRYSDKYRRTLRIHTKHVSTIEPAQQG